MELEAVLKKRFRGAAPDVEASFCLMTAHRPLVRFVVQGGRLRFVRTGGERIDATFFFDSEATALAVLAGEADPMREFMAGRFRADGNLPLAFVLLGLFRPDFGAPPP